MYENLKDNEIENTKSKYEKYISYAIERHMENGILYGYVRKWTNICCKAQDNYSSLGNQGNMPFLEILPGFDEIHTVDLCKMVLTETEIITNKQIVY